MIVLVNIVSRIDNDADREFFSSLYCDHEETMYMIARKYSPSQSLCDDIVQDALIGLMPQIEKLRTFDCCSLRAYVVTTVKNTALNYWRKSNVEKKYMCFDLCPGNGGIRQQVLRQIEDDMIQEQETEEFYELLRKLTARDQDILIRKYYLNQTDEEIAAYHGCKANSVRMMMTRARRSMREELNKKGFANEFNR